MSRFVPIGPPKLLHKLVVLHNFDVSYLMLLAPQVINNREEYKTLLRDFKGTIFLDNGAAEQALVDFQDISTAFDSVRQAAPNATIIVCYPDCLEQGPCTTALVRANHKEWQALQANGYMAIPQGVYYKDFMECFWDLREILGPCAFWGIPRHMTAKLGTRKWLIEEVSQHLRGPERIHMLGFSNHLVDDLTCARMPEVYSIDSQVPLMYGCLDIPMHKHMQIVRDKRFWDCTNLNATCVGNLKWVEDRIK